MYEEQGWWKLFSSHSVRELFGGFLESLQGQTCVLQGLACLVKYHTCYDWVWSYADLDWSPRGPISNKVIGIVSEKLLSANNQWYKEHYQNKHLETEKGTNNWNFYRTRVRSLFTLVTHSLTDWLTDSLTHCCLVNLIDVTLACEDTNSKLVEVVTVADVSDEDLVGNSLLQIWKLNFGHKAKLLFRPVAQGLIKILKFKFRQDLKMEFGQYFETDVWFWRFWS